MIKGNVRKIKSLVLRDISYTNKSRPSTMKDTGKNEKAIINIIVAMIVKKGIIRLLSRDAKIGIDRINLTTLQTLFFGNILSIYALTGINTRNTIGIENRAITSYAPWIFVKSRKTTTAPMVKIPIMIIHVRSVIKAGEFIILYRNIDLDIFRFLHIMIILS